MAVRSCRFTVTDVDGITHSARVTAPSLDEAVALGLKTIRGSDWIGEIAEGSGTVHVSVDRMYAFGCKGMLTRGSGGKPPYSRVSSTSKEAVRRTTPGMAQILRRP
jgi:hypothetical protein